MGSTAGTDRVRTTAARHRGYAALLRGINVSGSKRVPMAE
ncbi:DUF1697 domain-containing protein, partial [Streptomyces californicus]